MEATRSIANILFSVSAYAQRHGLESLQKMISEAAIAAMAEVQGSKSDDVLVALASYRTQSADTAVRSD